MLSVSSYPGWMTQEGLGAGFPVVGETSRAVWCDAGHHGVVAIVGSGAPDGPATILLGRHALTDGALRIPTNSCLAAGPAPGTWRMASYLFSLSASVPWQCGLVHTKVADRAGVLSACETVRLWLAVSPPGPSFFLRWSPARSSRLQRALDLLSRALLTVDQGTVAQGVAELVGWGTGLTPGGDDFLLGLAATLWALSTPHADLLGSALSTLLDRTTPLSATLLRHAMEGRVNRWQERFIQALAAGEARRALAWAARLTSYGATSGVENLLGVLWGIDLVTSRGDRGARTW